LIIEAYLEVYKVIPYFKSGVVDSRLDRKNTVFILFITKWTSYYSSRWKRPI